MSEVISAAGLKITSPDLTGVLAGSPLYVVENKEDEDRLKPLVESEIKSAIINNTDSNGVILRCDTIGSIEAIMDLLKKSNVPYKVQILGRLQEEM